MKRIKILKKNRGFSLIELMVATSIFVVIMLAAMGALFVLLDGAKNARAMRISMDNVNFAMESMSRSIRMGNKYYCSDSIDDVIMNDMKIFRDCHEGQEAIAFLPSTNAISRIAYKKLDVNGRGVLQRCDSSGCVDMISPNINITKLKFFTFGTENENYREGVYIIMQGEVTIKDVITDFSIQTMASMRNF
jgi:prepilin-type N-terminal cleavage/methylation domain-containing protein